MAELTVMSPHVGDVLVSEELVELLGTDSINAAIAHLAISQCLRRSPYRPSRTIRYRWLTNGYPGRSIRAVYLLRATASCWFRT
jgi:hypothetical protein